MQLNSPHLYQSFPGSWFIGISCFFLNLDVNIITLFVAWILYNFLNTLVISLRKTWEKVRKVSVSKAERSGASSLRGKIGSLQHKTRSGAARESDKSRPSSSP